MFRFSQTAWLNGVLLGLTCNAALPAFASDDANLLTRNTLTGDWGGLRHQMDEDGVKFTGDYSGETAYNADGGLHRSARYSQNIKLGVQFDLSKLYGVDNAGKVQLSINDRRGNSASEDLVGNRLPIQENYGGLYTRLTELSYERSLFTPALNVKLGYMAMGNDLGGLDSGILCNFMNAGFCGHPLNMSGGSGWTNYPNARLGVRVKYDLSPEWQLRVAAFNVDPESNGNSSRAWHLGPKHTTGTVVPIELVYKHAGELPGEYKVGYYYDSSDVKRIGSDKEVSGRGGHYLLIDQAVWRSETSEVAACMPSVNIRQPVKRLRRSASGTAPAWSCTNPSKAARVTPLLWATAARCPTRVVATCCKTLRRTTAQHSRIWTAPNS